MMAQSELLTLNTIFPIYYHFYSFLSLKKKNNCDLRMLLD